MSAVKRLHIEIQGLVQGIGFRPFVYHCAQALSLKGWVSNTSSGAAIEVEGYPPKIEKFLHHLKNDIPHHGCIYDMQTRFLDISGFNDFTILESETSPHKTVPVLPDLATCTDCRQEILDPHNRRFLYPFTNCTHCGPRYSIIESIPYDRCNTSMKKFSMCANCSEEYHNPVNRRFHAQPNACSVCGPQLSFWDHNGQAVAHQNNALSKTVDSIKDGKIVAVKGIGGFHLLADARNERSILILRERKHRLHKPLALMFPNIIEIEKVCEMNFTEKNILQSTAAPIVLLKRKRVLSEYKLAESIAPNNPYLGIMLPYAPLYHLLMHQLGIPVVATSGNISEEPICIDENEALLRLQNIADCFLMHDRPIVRAVDDSVVRVVKDRLLILRRSRGYAPLPIHLNQEQNCILACGGHLKNTIALNIEKNVYVSQHIGDLSTPESWQAYKKTIQSFQDIYEPSETTWACDLHPHYLSSQYANAQNKKIVAVQHHHAHIAACMAENNISTTVLGVAWDGAGYGPDRTIWGGEFLVADFDHYKRVAHLKTFPLPGAEKAIYEPRRTALGLLTILSPESLEKFKDLESYKAFTPSEIKLIQNMIERKINSPLTSSMGRLFDGIASLLGLHQKVHFEGQAAMALEYIIDTQYELQKYNFNIAQENEQNHMAMYIDWRPLIEDIIQDIRACIPKGKIAFKFHNTLTEIIITIARKINKKDVVLTGGCFQNVYLLQNTIDRLYTEGFQPYWHQWIPPNDGGIALGQIMIASHIIKKENKANVFSHSGKN